MKLFISIGCDEGERLDIVNNGAEVMHSLTHEAASCVIDVDPADAAVMILSRKFGADALALLNKDASPEGRTLVDRLLDVGRAVIGNAGTPAATPETAIPEPSTEAAMPAGAADPAGSAPGAAAAT